VIGLNIGWFSCVLGAAWNSHWLGALIVPILGAIHVVLIGRARLLPAILLVVASLTVGLILDTALIAAGAFEPSRWFMPHPMTTIWLLMLWVNFSLALNESLAWFQENLVVAGALGSLFGPLAYFSASRLGAIEIVNPAYLRLLPICLAWSVAMPLMSLTAKYLYNRSYRFRNR
jgi:hypothetical protein